MKRKPGKMDNYSKRTERAEAFTSLAGNYYIRKNGKYFDSRTGDEVPEPTFMDAKTSKNEAIPS